MDFFTARRLDRLLDVPAHLPLPYVCYLDGQESPRLDLEEKADDDIDEYENKNNDEFWCCMMDTNDKQTSDPDNGKCATEDDIHWAWSYDDIPALKMNLNSLQTKHFRFWQLVKRAHRFCVHSSQCDKLLRNSTMMDALCQNLRILRVDFLRPNYCRLVLSVVKQLKDAGCLEYLFVQQCRLTPLQLRKFLSMCAGLTAEPQMDSIMKAESGKRIWNNINSTPTKKLCHERQGNSSSSNIEGTKQAPDNSSSSSNFEEGTKHAPDSSSSSCNLEDGTKRVPDNASPSSSFREVTKHVPDNSSSASNSENGCMMSPIGQLAAATSETSCLTSLVLSDVCCENVMSTLAQTLQRWPQLINLHLGSILEEDMYHSVLDRLTHSIQPGTIIISHTYTIICNIGIICKVGRNFLFQKQTIYKHTLQFLMPKNVTFCVLT